jgi:hypothetical protein
LLSSQIDDDIALRYEASGILLLYGSLSGSPTRSTYTFFREIIGYDLASFFARHADTLRREIEDIAQLLLSA